MSDDLVTRLQDIAWVSPDASDATSSDKAVHEAADEIKRLRASLYIAESDRDYWHKKCDDVRKVMGLKRQVNWILVAMVFDSVLIAVLTIMLVGSFIEAFSS